MGIYDVPINELIIRAAEKLKSITEITPPEWAKFARTGMHKERPPVQKDWWYMRTAAVLLKINRLGPVGVSKLRTKFGGKKNRGVKPEHFFKGSGSVIRKVLQQLEKAELAKQLEKGVHKGRVITPKGLSFLDKIATEIMKEQNIVIPKKPTEQLKITTQKKKKKKKKKKSTRKKATRKKKVKKVVKDDKTAAGIKREIIPAKKPEELEKEIKPEVKKEKPVEKSESKPVEAKPVEE